MKVAFFGSGPFAIPALDALYRERERYPLVGVFSRPDRPARRGRKLLPTPLREHALEFGLECAAPETINSPESLDALHALDADLFIVADYGEILREEFLSIPRIGAFNLHGSLLPKYRGAAPVAYAIRDGETESGVTLFRIERALDSGPIVAMASTAIDENETASELEDRIAKLSADLLVETLPKFADGSFTETPQDPELVSFAPKLKKSEGLIDWTRSAAEVKNLLRAMSPWPSAYSFLLREGKKPERIVILRAEVTSDADDTNTQPGSIAGTDGESFTVACGSECLRVLELKREGKSAMDSSAFLRGCPLTSADSFVDSPEDGGQGGGAS